MSGNAQIQCLGKMLFCNDLQRCPLFLGCCEQVSLSLWEKSFCIVVVRPVDISVRGYIGVHIVLPKKQ